MSKDNVKITRNHFATDGTYFYFIDEETNSLKKKTSSGQIAFTYPIIDTIGDNPVVSMEYDGRFFWTLQQGEAVGDILFRKLYLENFVVYQDSYISLEESYAHKFDSEAFALEYYQTTLAEDLPKNSTSIKLTDYTTQISVGATVTLGPNDSGFYEDVTVTGTLSDGALGLNFFVQNDYKASDAAYFSENLWFFNKYNGTSPDEGALYRYDLVDKQIAETMADPDYLNVTASCYFQDQSYNYILMALGSNLRFFDLDNRVIVKTLTMDNILSDQITKVPVNALQVASDTIYRLQTAASYFGVDYTFSSNNYQPSPVRSFVDQVAVEATPKILPSNGINVAAIRVAVKNQYNHPAIFKQVEVRDSDDTGYITIQSTQTDINGIARSYYKAGIIPNNVLIMILVTQYD